MAGEEAPKEDVVDPEDPWPKKGGDKKKDDSKKEDLVDPEKKKDETADDEKPSDSSHRFMGWAALLFFSIVALASQVSATWDDERNADDWFMIVVSAISGSCAFISVLLYVLGGPNLFPGSYLEGFFAVLNMICWICVMPVIMDPDRDIAVSTAVSVQEGSTLTEEEIAAAAVTNTDTGSTTVEIPASTRVHEFTYIRNANIYFFSWACTICMVYILGRYVRQLIQESQRRASGVKRRLVFAPKTNMWYLLTMFSLIVWTSATKIFRAFAACDAEQHDDDLCLATKYAMSVGAVGTFFSFIASIMATCGYMGRWLELALTMLVFIMYMAGVALITFNDGPGTSLGNLYFASWMAAFITTVLLVKVYNDMVQYCRGGGDEEDEPSKLPDDVELSNKPEPVVFPSVEMGGDTKKNKDDDNVEDKDPEWATTSNEKPPAVPSKQAIADAEEEQSVEVAWNKEEDKAEPILAPAPSAESEEPEIALEQKETKAPPVAKEKPKGGETTTKAKSLPTNKKRASSSKKKKEAVPNKAEKDTTAADTKPDDNNNPFGGDDDDAKKEDTTKEEADNNTNPFDGDDDKKDEKPAKTEEKKTTKKKKQAKPAPAKEEEQQPAEGEEPAANEDEEGEETKKEKDASVLRSGGW